MRYLISLEVNNNQLWLFFCMLCNGLSGHFGVICKADVYTTPFSAVTELIFWAVSTDV